MTRIWRSLALCVRIFCAFAVLSIAFAHKPIVDASEDISVATLKALYGLPDGTLPVLCITVNDDGKTSGKDHSSSSGCEACRLCAGTILPTPLAATREFKPVHLAEVIIMRPETARRQLFPPNAAPRAPPFPVQSV